MCTQTARDPEICVRGILPVIWTAGNTEGLPLLLRRVVVSLRRAVREIPCSQLLLACPQMLSLHANNVLHRVRVLIGFVCTLIVIAALCGHATLEWWENGAGRCMAASRPLLTARWCGAHCGVDSAM
ncbi:hypothetical protein TcG_09307 [Trypanosoma cruzi]|nr:hypothetical protein TcG_09307 [Trypanosoma cruzi]